MGGQFGLSAQMCGFALKNLIYFSTNDIIEASKKLACKNFANEIATFGCFA